MQPNRFCSKRSPSRHQCTRDRSVGKPVYIALEVSDGVQCEHEDLDNPADLPEAIARLRKIALDKLRHLG